MTPIQFNVKTFKVLSHCVGKRILMTFDHVRETFYYIQKRMQNNGISKIMKMERPHSSLAVCNLLQHSQPITASVKNKFFHVAKSISQGQKVCGRKCNTILILHKLLVAS